MGPYHLRLAFAAVLSSLIVCHAACSSQDDAAPNDDVPPNTTGGTVTEEGGTSGGADASTGGGGDSGSSNDAGGKADAGPDMTAVQKHKAEMMTTFWENDTTIFQYAFSRNNNDGYGYTSGRVGFTTATGDAYAIVLCFDTAFGAANNLMKKYEAPLAALNAKKMMTGQLQPDITTLDAQGNFPADWKATANSATTGPKFAACQDQRVDKNYWTPAIAIAKQWGLSSALSNASFYDATIVHGEVNVRNLIKQANIDIGNTAQKVPTAPLSQMAESTFLGAFLSRRTALINSSTAWRGAIARGANYEQQRRNGNFDFSAVIVTSATANVVFPGNNYPSNGYQACMINPNGSVTGPAQCTAPVSN